jgi:hypothetical protein
MATHTDLFSLRTRLMVWLLQHARMVGAFLLPGDARRLQE